MEKRIRHRLKRLSSQEDLDSLVEDDRSYSEDGSKEAEVMDVPGQFWLMVHSSTLNNSVGHHTSQGEEQG